MLTWPLLQDILKVLPLQSKYCVVYFNFKSISSVLFSCLKDDLLISSNLFSSAEQTYMASIPEYVPNFYVWQVTGDGQQNEEIFY